MSVVNQMLKDLEDRKAENGNHSAVYQPSQKSGAGRLWLVLLSVVILILIVLLGFQYLRGLNQVQSDNRIYASNNTPVSLSPPPKEVSEATNTVQDVDAQVEETVNESNPSVPTDIQKDSISESAPAIISAQDNSVEPQQVVEQSMVAQPNMSKRQSESSGDLVVQKSATDRSQDPQPEFNKQSSGSQSSGTSLREQALAALRAGQEALAIQLLTALVQTEPANIAGRKKLAAVLYSQDQSVRATAVLEEGILQFPQDADLRLMLARLLSQQNENNRALTILTPELTLAGKSTEFLGFRAALAEQVGAHQIAHDDYLQLSMQQPNESRWWLGLAVSSERVLKPQVALDAYQRVVTQNQLSNEVQNFAQQRINQLVRTQ